MKRQYTKVTVELPFTHRCRDYQLSHDIQRALQRGSSKVLWQALINVPILEVAINQHYGKIVIPARILSVYQCNHFSHPITRSQFVSRDHLVFNDPNQVRFFQHDYARLNQALIATSLKYWKKIYVKSNLSNN